MQTLGLHWLQLHCMKNTETEINFALMGVQFQPLSGQRLLNQQVRDQLGECTLGPKHSGTVSECYALKHHVKGGKER